MHSNESLAHMRESKEQGAFLKALILCLESEERHRLHESLAKAERDGNCIRRAMFLVVVMLLISGAGLGYCALLLPEVFRDHTHLLTRSLSVLGLGSLISQVVFLGCLLWHRAVVTRLHEDCRHLVLALARSQLKVPAAPSLSVRVDTQSGSASPRSAAQQTGPTPLEPLSQEAFRSHS